MEVEGVKVNEIIDVSENVEGRIVNREKMMGIEKMKGWKVKDKGESKRV